MFAPLQFHKIILSKALVGNKKCYFHQAVFIHPFFSAVPLKQLAWYYSKLLNGYRFDPPQAEFNIVGEGQGYS